MRKSLHSSFCELLCMHTWLLAARCAQTYHTATPGARLCADRGRKAPTIAFGDMAFMDDPACSTVGQEGRAASGDLAPALWEIAASEPDMVKVEAGWAQGAGAACARPHCAARAWV